MKRVDEIDERWSKGLPVYLRGELSEPGWWGDRTVQQLDRDLRYMIARIRWLEDKFEESDS